MLLIQHNNTMHDVIHDTELALVYSYIFAWACSYQEQAVPSPVSPSGDIANSMQAGGNSNSCLTQLGEEEEKLKQEKKRNEDYTMHIVDNGKVVGPAVTLHDSSSLATTAASLSLDPVTKSANTVYDVSGHTATNAADSDTGSEDSRMNSDREPLLDNSCSC